MASEPFRFLDLPAELRCMVYEHIDNDTRLHTVEDLRWWNYTAQAWSTSEITIAIPSLRGCAILATCHAVFDEAYPILAPKLKRLHYCEPVHFIVNTCTFQSLFSMRGALNSAFFWETFDEEYNVEKLHYETRDFVSECATYMQRVQPEKIVLTVKLDHHADFDNFCFWEIFEDNRWKELFGVYKFEFNLYGFNDKEVEEIERVVYGGNDEEDRCEGAVRVLEEEEWSELWANEVVVGLNVKKLKIPGRLED
jgi:hypothetical protein